MRRTVKGANKEYHNTAPTKPAPGIFFLRYDMEHASYIVPSK